MEIFEALVNSMQIKDSEKRIILSSKANIEDMISEEAFVDANILSEDLISAIKNLNPEPKKSALLKNIVDLTYKIKSKYIRTEDIMLGTYVNATVEAKPRPKYFDGRLVGGDPMFFLHDDFGKRYDCFIKNRKDLSVGESELLWITNINFGRRMIYLEPRIEKHDKIYTKIKGFSRKNEPYFRFMNYDGFVKIFDRVGLLDLTPGQHYKLNSEYTRLSTNINRKDRKINRLGILFTHAIEKIDEETYLENQQRIIRAG